ncbi:hypothetical protein [Chryseobacterium gregarium]|uniref:hypothetical protein n=1 Tax=Chryseobacterium gregarium TaxID=456299 RepID=UPI0012DCEE4F|nr:hypothetical protein [Chryseobacterium gregarium]
MSFNRRSIRMLTPVAGTGFTGTGTGRRVGDDTRQTITIDMRTPPVPTAFPPVALMGTVPPGAPTGPPAHHPPRPITVTFTVTGQNHRNIQKALPQKSGDPREEHGLKSLIKIPFKMIKEPCSYSNGFHQ